MENIRKHRDINHVMNEEVYLKRVMKLNFRLGIILSESLMACVMNKPIYLGQATLDLSKIVMYEFYYDYIKLKYAANPQLHYMDTDSLVYDIKTDDFNEDITGKIKARLDMSSYSHSWVHPLSMRVNKKVISLMKDELGRRVMVKFVALRPKLYTYKMLGESGDKKCKGVKK